MTAPGSFPIRIATRASALATAQSRWVGERLGELAGRPVELIPVATPGDMSSAAIEEIGVGVFVSAVRDAVLADEADIAVHSLKDLPTQPADGLVLAAIPVREDPRDALFSRQYLRLHELPEGARVGTGSPRRIAFLRAARPDLRIRPIRGNVDTRLARLGPDDLDAVVLAAAGVHRLGRAAEITEYLDPRAMLPAPGQGALAVEVRADLADAGLVAALAKFDDPQTRAAVTAERRVLAAVEAGCTAPLGALARISGDQLEVSGTVVAHDGSRMLHMSEFGSADQAVAVGDTLARSLLAAGAADLLGVRNS